MFSPRKSSLPSPSLEDSFFPFALTLPTATSSPISGGVDGGGGLETDLILAAELGQALLEKNEELAATLEERERQVEVCQRQWWENTKKKTVKELKHWHQSVLEVKV